MNRRINMTLASLVVLLAAATTAVQAKETRFLFKPGGLTRVTFSSEASLEDITGVNNKVSGQMSLDLAAPAKTVKATVKVDMAAFRTGIDMRDEHFKNETWLNAAKYPTATFEVTRVEGKGRLSFGKKLKGVAHGKLTLHGTTREIKVPIEVGYYEATPAIRKRAYVRNHLLIVKGSFEINVKDYGVKGAEGLFGMKVSETVKISLKLAGEEQ